MIKHQTVDKVCAFSSLICSIHCLIMPALLILLPYVGMMYLENETLERTFIITSCLMALTSIYIGFRKHKNFTIFIPLSLGVVMLVISLDHNAHDNIGALRNFFGGLCICVSHLINMRLCRACSDCQHA